MLVLFCDVLDNQAGAVFYFVKLVLMQTEYFLLLLLVLLLHIKSFPLVNHKKAFTVKHKYMNYSGTGAECFMIKTGLYSSYTSAF